MAESNGRTTEQVRRDIEAERDRLADAVDDLRSGMDVNKQLKGKLPVAAAAALGVGFVGSGGVGAARGVVGGVGGVLLVLGGGRGRVHAAVDAPRSGGQGESTLRPVLPCRPRL